MEPIEMTEAGSRVASAIDEMTEEDRRTIR